jgi:hypothetical protein
MIRTVMASSVAEMVLEHYNSHPGPIIVTLPRDHMPVTENVDQDEHSRLIVIESKVGHGQSVSIRCRVYSRNVGRWVPDFLEARVGNKAPKVFQFFWEHSRPREWRFREVSIKGLDNGTPRALPDSGGQLTQAEFDRMLGESKPEPSGPRPVETPPRQAAR